VITAVDALITTKGFPLGSARVWAGNTLVMMVVFRRIRSVAPVSLATAGLEIADGVASEVGITCWTRVDVADEDVDSTVVGVLGTRAADDASDVLGDAP
jgi:hypothetical protein